MNNLTALIVGLAIVGLFVLDATVLHWDLPVQIGRQVLRLLDALAFWR